MPAPTLPWRIGLGNKMAQRSTEEIAALHEKYAEERAKRLRADGAAQYLSLEGDFTRFEDAPYGESRIERGKIVKDIEVLGAWRWLFRSSACLSSS